MDIGKCIAELLYEQESVSLPGLGSFTSRYKPAAIDHVQGKLSPPTKEIEFNANLVLDDGLLAEAAAQRLNANLGDAAAAVAAFVNEIRAVLDRREMFLIPGVGRLYKDFEQNLKFLPDEVNFNPETHGLPSLKYYPVVRRPVPGVPVAGKPAAKSADAVLAGWFQRNLAWLAVATVLVISLSIYWIVFAPGKEDASGDISAVPQEFLNVKPGQTEEEEEAPAPPDDGGFDDDEGAVEPVLPPDQKIGVIRIGRFGNEDNVKRLVRKAQELGLNPYTNKIGNLTEVGVRFSYTGEQEIKETLAVVRRSLAKDAVVERK